MGSAETERSVIGSEPARKPVGTVWVYCPYPVVAAGLSDALGGIFGVHLGRSAPAGGIGRPTTTNEQDSDAKIDQENNKADRTVGKICKNC